MELKFYYIVHKNPPLGYILNQINPVPKEINYLQDLDVDGKIILKRMLRTLDGECGLNHNSRPLVPIHSQISSVNSLCIISLHLILIL
jgi:hypothetical protein